MHCGSFFIASALLVLGGSACISESQILDDPRAHAARRAGFVSREDGYFGLDGRRVQFVGATTELVQGPVPRGWTSSLVRAAGESLSVLRVWAFNDGPSRPPNLWESEFFFRVGPLGWLPDAYAALDRVLAEARAARLRVILVLGNQWAAYGGIPQYSEWFLGRPRGEGVPPDHEGPTPEECKFFYTDPRAKRAYRAGVRAIVERRSTLTGIAYKDDPTILGYELMNEPRSAYTYAESQAYWNQEMARFIRGMDPSHLISTGLDNAASPVNDERAYWRILGRIPEIDYVDLHMYPGSGAPANPSEMADFDRRLTDVAYTAHQVLHKPVVLGELGFTPGAARDFARRSGTPSAGRNEILARTMESAVLRHGFDAAIFWLLSFDRNPERSHILNPAASEDRAFFDRMRKLRDQAGESR